ncbi:uncharacterized protein MONBRDRAFT_30756 [Monosiga brevicollis MX1]|uniref:Uncharacterized protein n=1 Tax=Monosiga brevicollis TaxID=81824 RepID=A9UP08_MONBE|nr:uncharacterized protein MONBRDRAFT_30756 [Monosiga brevicollis MX1]EDQ92792.1 predicted protein [Monosiga brevicollis MX1]|eukprot:XP_001742554.1 hypothetical protein [Monosiga brevicollis MX1]
MADTLPPKEAQLYRKLSKCYDTKQYKQALRHANAILASADCLDHPETLAMKALVYNSLEKRKEALETAKASLRKGIMKSLCWHVYGIIYRCDGNFEQAIKCYRQACVKDPPRLTADVFFPCCQKNQIILRDLASLQIQMRDLDGYRESRRKILMERADLAQNWSGLAVAHHLNQDYDLAIEVIGKWLDLQKESKTPLHDTELSETLFYLVQLHADKGDPETALKLLHEHDQEIWDRRGFHEMRAQLNLALGAQGQTEASEKAATIYGHLIDDNPEDRRYFDGLFEAKHLTEPAKRMAVLDEVHNRYPKATLPELLVLREATGDDFKSRVDTVLRSCLRKGMPPLFNMLRHLYVDSTKVATIQTLVEGYVASLEKDRAFAAGEGIESPAVLVWTKAYLAQHLDHLGQYDRALSTVREALAHTPTALEVYFVEARILKHMGRLNEAADQLELARSLDTADRYINARCVKYQVRAGQLEKADQNVVMYAKENGDPMDYLLTLQIVWFNVVGAKAYWEKRDIPRALGKVHMVADDFNTIISDQFDFHTYCLRKSTLRAYVRFLEGEDNLHGHPNYIEAAILGAQIYLYLKQKPYKKGGDEDDDPALIGMSEADKKKYLSKKRKAAKKAEAAAAVAATDNKAAAGKGGAKKEEEDLSSRRHYDKKGEEHALTSEPLEAALKLLKPALELMPKTHVDLYITAFEVYRQLNKLLPMCRMLAAAAQIDAEHPDVHVCRVQLLQILAGGIDGQDELVQKVLPEVQKSLFGSVSDAHALNETRKAKAAAEPKEALAYNLGRVALGEASVDDAYAAVVAVVAKAESFPLKDAQALASRVRREAPSQLQACQAACLRLWPAADAFKPRTSTEASA